MEHTTTYFRDETLAYADYGDPHGFPILIQHGLIASIDDANLFGRLIAHRARLVCMARPGYGRSSPYAMRSYAEWGEITSLLAAQLGLAQFDLLGMSSGAPYAYAVAAARPDRVRNVFIYSGIPALYDETIRSAWPHEMAPNPTIAQMQALAHTLFFSNLTAEDLASADIRDSMMNDCFGVAQDMRLRSLDWGFRLSQVHAPVIMRHSKTDASVPYASAIRTAELLPNCHLTLLEDGPHFSTQALDDFIRDEMISYYAVG